MGLTSKSKKENNIVELEISVGADELMAATDRVYKRKAKTISVPGFRKGKAPRRVIEKMYGEGVFMEDAVNDLYPKAYNDAVDEAGIEPVDRADVEIVTLDKETGLVFKATVTVSPEVTMGEYKGVKAEKPVYIVTDEDVDAEIGRMRERGARIITVEDRPAKDGDEVTIDFEGFVDGEAFEGGKAEGHSLSLGSNSFIDTFEKQIEGHNIGDEFDVNVTFPEEYHAEELKGKPALFKVKLNEIKGRELPELDDEFAKDVSEFDTLDELRADLRGKQEEARRRRSDEELETNLLDEVIKNMSADIPACMIESRVDDMVHDFEHRISSQGMSLEIYLQYAGMDMDAFRAGFKAQAERQVKVRLALQKIAELEKIEPTSEDIEAEYAKYAEMYGMEPDKIKEVLPEKDMIADIKCARAIDLVKGSAEVTEKVPEKPKDGEESPAEAE